MSASGGSACRETRTAGDTRWPLERVLFAIAGSVVLVAAALTALVSQWFLLLVVFAGINQWLFVVSGDCPMSIVLTRFFGLRRAVQR